MAKFAFLYIGGSVPENEAEQAATMKAWRSWFGGLGSALVDGGNAFTSNAKSITSNGTINDGSLDLPVTGYSIVKADSLNGALALAKGCPLLRSGSHGQVRVYEVDETLAM